MATIYRQTIVPAEELYEGCLIVDDKGGLGSICEIRYHDFYIYARDEHHRWIRWGYRTLVHTTMPIKAVSRKMAIKKATEAAMAEARRAWS
jgi:hypothetical protein